MGIRGLWVCPGPLGLQKDHQKWGEKKTDFGPPLLYVLRGMGSSVSSLGSSFFGGGQKVTVLLGLRPHLTSLRPCQRQRAYGRPKDSDATEQRCRQGPWGQSALIRCVPSSDPFPFPSLNLLVSGMGTHTHAHLEWQVTAMPYSTYFHARETWSSGPLLGGIPGILEMVKLRYSPHL